MSSSEEGRRQGRGSGEQQKSGCRGKNDYLHRWRGVRGTRKEGKSENTSKRGGVIGKEHPDDGKWELKSLEAGWPGGRKDPQPWTLRKVGCQREWTRRWRGKLVGSKVSGKETRQGWELGALGIVETLALGLKES